MTYQESLDFLYSSLPMYQRSGAAAYKNNLAATLKLDELHDHPHRSFKSIHIAGTNGKGSVSHMMAAILQKAGYKTGLYTSPHLKDFRERIKVNGIEIPEKEVTAYLQKNKEFISEIKPSFFEMTVDLAFLFFASQKVDIAIVETGMGGRLDSTNIISPILSVITNIGMDHTRFLGDSLSKIAMEKAGIIKQNTPLVIGEYHPETFPVFEAVARKKSARCWLAEKQYSFKYSQMDTDRKVRYYLRQLKENKDFSVLSDLTGQYQRKNLITTLTALDVLRLKGVDEETIASGLRHVKKLTGLRGRWDETAYNPMIIFDTAHNAEGVQEVTHQLNQLAYKNLHIIWGMVNDKNIGKILQLLPKNAKYYFTKADIPRSLNEITLKEIAEENGLHGLSFPKAEEALRAARMSAIKEDVIFVGGSTFLVGELI